MKTAKYFVHTWTLYEVSRIEAWTTADITWHSLSKTNFNTLSLSTAFSLFLVSFVWPSTYRAQYIIDSAIIAATARKYVFSLYLAGHMTRLSDPIRTSKVIPSDIAATHFSNVVTTHTYMCFRVMINHYKHIQCISANLETSSRTLKFANIRTEGFWVNICSFSVKHYQVSFFAAQNNGCKKNNTGWDWWHVASVSKYFSCTKWIM